MSKTRQPALSAIVSLFIVLAWAAPASAADGYQETYAGIPSSSFGCDDFTSMLGKDTPSLNDPAWGQACFYFDTDEWYVLDKQSDGRSVGVQWRLIDGSRSGLIRDKLGAGVNSILNKSYPNGTAVKWRIGHCNTSGGKTCTNASDFTWQAGTLCSRTSTPGGYACQW
ncbi:hypothetical protein [Nocardioides zhouii]|uniref:Secreted protein n=1 Tax=Nocardioides zhouii TaxID=1168729 RepID=A0A4Q2TAK7_9ACTN|nr:hypothetical protein [Nocardioides zhouii]RYC14280.1 hypothetical protein EUA94_02975 [Nocardioides zhouii]